MMDLLLDFMNEWFLLLQITWLEKNKEYPIEKGWVKTILIFTQPFS